MKHLLPLLTLLLASLALADTGTGQSGNITVDTRNLTMTALTITGQSSVPWGSEAIYTATLSYTGVPPENVTAQCEWSVTGGPKITNWWEQAQMNGNILHPHVASAIPLLITASITRTTGRIVSAAFPVTVTESNGMNIGIVFSAGVGPVYVRTDGSNFVWRVAAEASGLAAEKPGVTFQWSLDGQTLATGKHLDVEITGVSGIRQLALLATDSAGRTGQDYKWLIFNSPLGVNEPTVLIPAVDPFFGETVKEKESDPNGGTELFGFDPLKIPNGLIVLTHGLYGKGSDDWLWQMARAIRLRLIAAGKPLPNIVIFGWGNLSDPSKYWGFDAARDRAIEKAKSVLERASTTITSATIGTMADFILVRPHGQSEGQELADWIRTEITNGHISASAPIQLIGHSAGGFVVGECGWQVRNLCSKLRVTMLDTPLPFFNHLWRYPASGRKLDRYVSSFFGATEYPTTIGSNLINYNDYLYWLLLSLSPLAGPEVPLLSAHSYSHDWYAGTVTSGMSGSEGFGLSPFLSSSALASTGEVGAGKATETALSSPPVEMTVPVTGFTTFGTVAPDAQGFVLTEGAAQNAGLTRAAYTFPAGTYALRFAFRFTTPGDGDFLTVSFGNNPPIFTGKDMPLTRDGELSVDVPVEHLANETGDLVFRLVSRGQPNAVVTIHSIVAVTMEDADGDGLSNAAEVALGTNPMSADTDHDGLTDSAEVNIYHTNPLVADTDGDGVSDGDEVAAGTDPKNATSRFAIKAGGFLPGGFSLQWWAQTTRSYRVLRSADPGFGSYDVIGTALPGASPSRSFLDTTLLPGQAPRMFFKIQLEPQP